MMKAIILYYSFTGNTKRVAEILAEYLGQRYELKIKRLEAKDESAFFIKQATRALLRKQANVFALDFDLSIYDLICFGTPVWAFGPAPAMNTYLAKCSGLTEKTVG